MLLVNPPQSWPRSLFVLGWPSGSTPGLQVKHPGLSRWNPPGCSQSGARVRLSSEPRASSLKALLRGPLTGLSS